MATRVKGNRYCDRCQKPVAAIRSTHRAGNATAAVAAPLTGGLSLAGLRRDPWVCPSCGGPTTATAAQARTLTGRETWLTAVWVGLLVLMGAIIGLHALGLF